MAWKKRKSPIVTQTGARKAKRKEERQAKRKRRTPSVSNSSPLTTTLEDANVNRRKQTKGLSRQVGSASDSEAIDRTRRSCEGIKHSVSGARKDPYAHLSPELAAALRNDDAEIAQLEANLGLGRKDRIDKLHREYAKLEGYGDDFGEFLNDLDGMVGRVSPGDVINDGSSEPEGSEEVDLSSARAKVTSRRNVDRISDRHESDSSEAEELVPMKGPASNPDSDSSENDQDGSDCHEMQHIPHDDSASNSGSESPESDEETFSTSKQRNDEGSVSEDDDAIIVGRDLADRHTTDVYHPIPGQDLYGNTIDNNMEGGPIPKKYVPPHFRQKNAEQLALTNGNITPESIDNDDPNRKEEIRLIQRSLNNNLNRLSYDTLVSVTSSIAGLYSSHSTHDVNECFWENIRHACVSHNLIMAGLIPLYMACVSGVHIQNGNTVQLGGHIVEKVVTNLCDALQEARNANKCAESLQANEEGETIHKEPANFTLLLCYLYNYNIVHCTLVYDVIRELIINYTEVDMESLLLILSHCGFQLRQDDPSAMKDIVLMVQERALGVVTPLNDASTSSNETRIDKTARSSRVKFMISAITDLKNNKRKSKDVALGEKTMLYRKAIGRMKTAAAIKSGFGKVADPCLRITLRDILDIETMGRWWKVGASWLGNQFHNPNSVESVTNGIESSTEHSCRRDEEKDELLVLAAKQRMNSDVRRSIFCMVMGSDDCEDAFEKLLRAGMLKGKLERDVVRIVIDCCGQENSYNPYYSFLACRLCDYQPKCKFTIQLAFWDVFKQFDDMKARKAANLGKLLAHLVGVKGCINLSVLKTIDISPGDMPEMTVIFLTIFFSSLFESLDNNPERIFRLLKKGTSHGRAVATPKSGSANDNDLIADDDEGESLRESLCLFLQQYLKSSPKNVKGSNFRKHYKAALKACEMGNLDDFAM